MIARRRRVGVLLLSTQRFRRAPGPLVRRFSEQFSGSLISSSNSSEVGIDSSKLIERDSPMALIRALTELRRGRDVVMLYDEPGDESWVAGARLAAAAGVRAQEVIPLVFWLPRPVRRRCMVVLRRRTRHG